MTRANIPAIKEPAGLLRSDGKRPDGLTQIPWQAGKCLTWDVTIADTLATSYLTSTSRTAGSAPERAAAKKIAKYTDLARTHIFCPLAFESLGPMNELGQSFISELGRRIAATTGDTREGSFLFQRISIAIQRCNAISFAGTFIQPCFHLVTRDQFFLRFYNNNNFYLYTPRIYTTGEKIKKNKNKNCYNSFH